MATLTDEARGVLARGEATAPSGENTLVPTGNCLPAATCYGLLLSLAGRRLETPEVITSIGRCFRNEDHYDGLRRLRSFHMREALFVGSKEGVVDHLTRATELVFEFVSDDGTAIAPVNRHRIHAVLQVHGDPQPALAALNESVA